MTRWRNAPDVERDFERLSGSWLFARPRARVGALRKPR